MKKKLSVLIAGVCFILLTYTAHAQSTTDADYFTGKWNVLVKGTPNGDAKMLVVLQKSDSTMTGVIQDTTGTDISKIDRVELNGDKIILYFNAQGYDVNLEMDKKDDDHITGNMMSLFDAEGERVKDAVQ
ncbi:MAG: hypothetical protein JST21_11060 [Bacteroidetes bacterium]|nr:hypothetical protein [Bacteroidota bacterium]